MPKTFYTEKDIEELFRNGTRSLQVNDHVSLTDLAYEKAKQLGLQLLFEDVDLPPIAPVRPYLSNGSPQTPTTFVSKPKVDSVSPVPASQTQIEQRIRSAVLARLGNQVDAKLLDSIIQRVVKATGVK